LSLPDMCASYEPFPENYLALDSFSVYISLLTGPFEHTEPPKGNVVTFFNLVFLLLSTLSENDWQTLSPISAKA